ncbi:MAG: T9SS type A sorting domain-containing protein [Flavobacteriales bacterium]|nr:T9SS type A sorting domain-containing protein [Flavobacteriales bacterium]
MKKFYSLAIMTLLSVYGFGQVNGFSNLAITNTEGSDITFDVTYEYDVANPDFKSVKLYYTINKDYTDAEWLVFVDAGTEGDNGRVTEEIDEKADDNKYSFSIPAANVTKGDIIKFYFRGYTKNADGDKEKEYFTPDQGSEFDHDVYSEWSNIVAYGTLSNDLFNKASVSLYPIPAGNNLTFKSELNEVGTFDVFNISGKLMMSSKGNLNNNILNISKLNRGNYILKVSTSSNSHSFKFTK